MSLVVWLPLNGDIKNYGDPTYTTSVLGSLSNVSGKIGSAYRFDTGSQTGNGISINTNLLGKLGNNFSIACWVNPYGNHVHYNGTIFSSGNWNNKCWAFGLSQDNTKVDVFGNRYNTWMSCEIPINTWTHLACVNNNGTCSVYKNGVFIGTGTASASIDSDASNCCVGRETYAGGYFGFNGAIQDLRVYNHSLSYDEIKDISKALVLHYPLSDINIGTISNLLSVEKANYISGWGNWCNSGGTTPTTQYLTGDGVFTNNYIKETCYQGNTSNCAPYTGYTIPANITYTFSAWIKGDSSSIGKKVHCSHWTNDGTTVYNKQPSYVLTNTWQHVEAQLKVNAQSSAMCGVGADNDACTSANCVYYVCNAKLEARETSSDWTPGGQTITKTAIIDCSGYNRNGTATGDIQVTTGSGRGNHCTSFSGGNNTAIQIPFTTAVVTGDFTASMWFYKSEFSSYSWDTIFGGPSGFELETKNGSNNTPVIYAYSWGQGSFDYTLNTWHHLVMTRNSTETKFYLDGTLKLTGSAGSIPGGSYFIGAWMDTAHQLYKGLVSDFRVYASVLSSDDISKLYHNFASIYNNGSLSAYDFTEV